MSELAVVLLAVDSEKQTPDPDGPFPVFWFDPDEGATWQGIKEQITASGVPKIFLQFSNETIDIPQHNWKYTDWQYRRYHRLYHAADIVSSVSPLACLGLSRDRSLPGLHIEAREINPIEQGRFVSRLLYYLDTRMWEQAETILTKAGLDTDGLFALSYLYEKTNRFEEAYATSLKALSMENAAIPPVDAPTGGQDEPSSAVSPTVNVPHSFDQAGLWLAHGIHAARCGYYEQAAAAFRMSDADSRRMEPLYIWADELLRQGMERDEALVPVEAWLERSPDKEVRLIQLMYRIGLYKKALEKLEQLEAAPEQLIRIRFDCLILAGRIAEAVLLFRGQDAAYSVHYPTEALLCRMLLADGELNLLASPLEQHELEALQDRAVALRLFGHAVQLQPYIHDPLSLAFSLFRHGYVMRAAAYFLQALKENTMNQAAHRCMGEILYYRGAYEQAAGIFEYLLSQAPGSAPLRTALALTCLRQSEALLSESMYIFPSSIFLREEAEKVAAGIKRMEQSSAITQWRWAERMNFHE